MGKKLLAAGQLADALSHFHAAIGMYLMKVTLALKYLWVWVFFVVLFASLSVLLSCKLHSMCHRSWGTFMQQFGQEPTEMQ